MNVIKRGEQFICLCGDLLFQLADETLDEKKKTLYNRLCANCIFYGQLNY